MKWRFVAIVAFFYILYFGLVFNLYYIQLYNGKNYIAKMVSQIFASGLNLPQRGGIFFTDKNNNLFPAASNKDFSVIFAVPKEVQENINNNITMADYANKLSEIVGISRDEIIKKLNKKNDLYELLVKKASDDQVNKIKEINLKGVYVDNQRFRFYPFGDLGSQLLGFVASVDDPNGSGNEEVGRYGIELKFNDFLSGKSGEVSGGKVSQAQDGKDLVLTVDDNLEFQSQQVLSKLISDNKAESGEVIIEDPKTGKILAMTSLPSFDPNDYSKYDIKNFMNPAVQLVYEPGSVVKVITMAAGIDSGKITPATTYVDTGSVVLNGRKIQNWDHNAYGKINMTNVIEHSLNVGAVFAQRTMGQKIFRDYLVKFGFGDFTNINLPGEVRGSLNNLNGGRDIDFATASYGQGISVTPIQLISAISAIANGGNLMKPLILEDEQPQIIRRVISEDTAKKVAQMMVSAVKVNKLADINNYSIAGKTGTAYIPDFAKKKYSNDVINTYVGFAPAFDPKFVLLIRLDKPVGAPLAGTTVVPAFHDLTQFILNYYNVAPDQLGN